MVLGQLCEQAGRLVASLVAHELVEGIPAQRVKGRRNEHSRPRVRDPRQLRQRRILIVDMLDDVESAHEIEGGRREGQGGHLAERDARTPVAQLGQRRRADIHKLRPLDRQARPQSRRHFEPPDGCGYQGMHERPRVELLSFDEPAPRPERVVEAAVLLEEITLAGRL